MLGYLGGGRIGSPTYNVVHTDPLPLAMGAYGVWADGRLIVLVTLIWIGHIGADRMFGFGLKYASGFRDTHLGSRRPQLGVLGQADRDASRVE